MDLDDKVCLCFGVSKRKVVNFIRIENPRVAGQISECFGAGTGCGWCRPYLRMMFEKHRKSAFRVDRDPQTSGDDRASSSPSHPVAGSPASGTSPTAGGSFEKLDAKQYAQLRETYMDDTGKQPPAESTDP